ncbi:MAG: hypothetical protein ABI693_28415 [Bryobacteraceae bacterium]
MGFVAGASGLPYRDGVRGRGKVASSDVRLAGKNGGAGTNAVTGIYLD